MTFLLISFQSGRPGDETIIVTLVHILILILSLDCLETIHVWAKTGTVGNTGSDDSPFIEIDAVSQVRSLRLPDLPADDYTEGKVDMFRIPMGDFGFSVYTWSGVSSCVRPSDIQRITIVEGGDDGWNIEHILVTGIMYNGQFDMLAENMFANRWIDGDGGSGDERFDLKGRLQWNFQKLFFWLNMFIMRC